MVIVKGEKNTTMKAPWNHNYAEGPAWKHSLGDAVPHLLFYPHVSDMGSTFKEFINQ